MRTRIFFLLFFISFQLQSEPVEQVSFSDVLEQSSRFPDRVLQYGEEESQFVEIWLPSNVTQAPVVALIHGGCWLNAYGVDHVRPAATALAEEGFAVWAIEYRRLGEENAGWPSSKNDIVAALSQLKDSAADTLDLERLALVGHSAGGHLALLATEDLTTSPKLTLGLAAITDLTSYAARSGSCQAAGAQFLATATTPSALNAPEISVHPRILFAGEADAIVDLAQAQLGDTEAVVVENAGHFDFIHPQSRAFQSWVSYLKQHLMNDKQ